MEKIIYYNELYLIYKDVLDENKSDIFNLENNELSKMKSGEKSFFKKRLQNFTASNESKSSWQEMKTLPKNLQDLLAKNFSILSFTLSKLQASKKSRYIRHFSNLMMEIKLKVF